MKPVYILGTPGRINEPEGRSIQEILDIAGLNTGNLMFQFAVARMIGADKRFIGRANIPYAEAGGCGDGSHLVFPAANHLRIGADWSGLCGFFENSKVPLVIIGLGAQADSTTNPAAVAASIRADASASRLADVIREKSAWISVRGVFTAEVCQLLGIHDIEVLGCPSLMLNPNEDAGRRIAAKLAAAATNRTPRLSLTAAGPFDIRGGPKAELERQLFNHVYSNRGLYVQQSGGDTAVAASWRRFDQVAVSALISIRETLAPELALDQLVGFLKDRGRFFTSAEDWIRAMKPLDCCFGTRLHGNMAAIAADVPGCVVSHDSRTDELADEMKLPRLDAADVPAARKTRDLIRRVRFDAAAFDRSRAKKRLVYENALHRLGLCPWQAASEPEQSPC
jgi:hypothetical protein